MPVSRYACRIAEVSISVIKLCLKRIYIVSDTMMIRCAAVIPTIVGTSRKTDIPSAIP